jgi:hypothetical protein
MRLEHQNARQAAHPIDISQARGNGSRHGFA